ncbi:MAG TPA: FecR domain-containing protein [Sphingomicrobium sp.]|nr:FecR domain-containing protein [Sphingomicrobium sp.]
MSERNARGKEGPLEEAAAWFARMRGPEAEASRAEFERWLARGALHRAAYNRAAEVFAMGKLLADDDELEEVSGATQKGRPSGLLFGALAAASLVVVASSLFVLHESSISRNRSNITANGVSGAASVDVAAVNDRQVLRLSDNSMVRLDTGSMLAVQFGKAERKLSLQRGTARFYVAHEHRPFIVYAGGGYVVAHGTIFDVGVTNNHRVTVKLIQGVIDVATPQIVANGRRATQSRRLRAGETLSFEGVPSDVASPLPQRSSVTAASLQDEKGAREYQSISLADLVDIANAGAATPIRIADVKSGELRVSGKFRVDDTNLLADRLAALFNLVIDRTNPSEIVLRPK